DDALLDLFASQNPRDGLRSGSADAPEVLRNTGFEIATSGDRFARLRIGVDAGDDNAFSSAARSLDSLQGAQRRLVPGRPNGLDAAGLGIGGKNGLHLGARIGNATVGNVRRDVIEDLDVGEIAE